MYKLIDKTLYKWVRSKRAEGCSEIEIRKTLFERRVDSKSIEALIALSEKDSRLDKAVASLKPTIPKLIFPIFIILVLGGAYFASYFYIDNRGRILFQALNIKEDLAKVDLEYTDYINQRDPDTSKAIRMFRNRHSHYLSYVAHINNYNSLGRIPFILTSAIEKTGYRKINPLFPVSCEVKNEMMPNLQGYCFNHYPQKTYDKINSLSNAHLQQPSIMASAPLRDGKITVIFGVFLAILFTLITGAITYLMLCSIEYLSYLFIRKKRGVTSITYAISISAVIALAFLIVSGAMAADAKFTYNEISETSNIEFKEIGCNETKKLNNYEKTIFVSVEKYAKEDWNVCYNPFCYKMCFEQYAGRIVSHMNLRGHTPQCICIVRAQ
jgi:hypothetical protein